ncbi:MAG: O-antigen ligase family protein [Lunatimonas sp.]|uniref:O-antigen ligase family protein n=1 Tax=Lunatimonas sp. TaxID=2060141 RepID=UPI00263A696E|nr:O-antigen ligase family protein [Lunatimonas sp.]MCC5935921.1 O-antigen ligase family protein [Lunatimonas sp.]
MENQGKIKVFLLIAATILTALVMVTYLNILGIAALFAIPIAVVFFYWVLQHPRNALYFTIGCAFMAIGVIRYLPSLPLGLTVDFALILSIVAAAFHTNLKTDFNKLENGLMVVTGIWLLYNIAQIANPEARSTAAWFYAVRGTALYMVLTIPITLLYARTNKDLDRFFKLIFSFSLLASIWGLRQYIFGVDAAEERWLNTGPRTTHILFGNLRVFSFFSDAGQFGAGIGHAGLMAAILAVGPFPTKTRITLGVMALLFFYLLVISGTRGALFVPIAGAMAYLFASKNFTTMGTGILVLGALFFFLKFSNIGNQNYQIRRMRSALDPQDASLTVRKLNQERFKMYLATRPFGGGIGTSGSWGQRFSPGTFLAETPNDSWYVKIWAEMGIIGLSLHLFILAYISLIGLLKIWKVKDPRLRQKLLALFAGNFGILVASYGNPILGQMPTGIIIYMSWAYFFLAVDLDNEILEKPKITHTHEATARLHHHH